MKVRPLWSIVLGVIFLIVLYGMLSDPADPHRQPDMAYSEFQTLVEKKQVQEVTLRGDLIQGKQTNGQIFVTKVPQNTTLANELSEKGVHVQAASKEKESSFLWDLLASSFPILLLIGFYIFFFRNMQGGAGRAMGFGRSKAKLMNEVTKRVTFADVAGAEEAKHEVAEIVDFLRDPQKFQRLGGKIPRGVLLVGPPGTGKTLLARAIAGEAEVPFFSISGSDFVEMFVGVGASRVRDMFEQGKKSAPCIIFIDEIDAVGRHRGAGLGGGNDEREQTLNQLLVEMDGFNENQGIILIAATNRPDVLDPALLRPGRFDRQVVVGLPDVTGREAILEVHMKRVPLADDVNPRILARGTPGFSGADLSNLVNEAALMAARRGRRVVGMKEFEEARDKVMMGAERRTFIMSEKEKKVTAYHEAGHALVAYHMPGADPIHKATIVPRGMALGMVQQLPEGDSVSMTRQQLEARLAILMAGRVAEEEIFGNTQVTTGASNDIKVATNMARRMVCEWGMSDVLGPLAYAAPQQEVFLGHSVTQTQNISQETAIKIDHEVRKLIEAGYGKARQLLTEFRHHLALLAEKLLEHETLNGQEIQTLFTDGELVKADDGGSAPKRRMRSSISSMPRSPKTTPFTPEPQPGV